MERRHDPFDPGKHAVPHVKPSDLAANGNNFAREFVTQHKRKPWPQDRAKLPLSELEIKRVQTCSAYINENIAWPRHRRPGHPSAASLQGRHNARERMRASPAPALRVFTSPTSGLNGPDPNVEVRLNVNGKPGGNYGGDAHPWNETRKARQLEAAALAAFGAEPQRA